MKLDDSVNFSIGTDRKKIIAMAKYKNSPPDPCLLVHVLQYPFPWVQTASVNVVGDSHSLEQVTFYEMQS